MATTDDNKTCYITQPFGYNYALVNQFQNGITGIATTVDGRIVVNKPIANTVSSISFKCDVCGAMFSQLGHLNQHKRLHTQDGTDTVQTTASGSGNHDTITVVTSSGGQSFLQGQNIISETGQTLGQIQIVNADQLEQHQQQQQHQDVTLIPNNAMQQQHQQQQHLSQQITITPAAAVSTPSKHRGPKCSQCGGPRRKGSKGGRCETCVKSEQQQQRATQIFVTPDGEVKFETPEMDEDAVEEVATAVVPMAEEIVEDEEEQEHQHQQQQSNKQYHPVKKRNSTVVSKCNRCNGTGLIYVEASGATTSCGVRGGHGQSVLVAKREKSSPVVSNTITVDLEDSMQPPHEPVVK